MSVLSIMPFDTEMSDSALEQVADILRPAFEAMYDAVDVLEPLEPRAEGHILGVMPSGNLLLNVDVFDHLDLVDLLSESNTLVITDRHLIPEEFYEFGKGRYNPLYGCAEGANAYITTLPFHGRGVERFVRRVSVLALHEVGHLNGLEHQYGLSDHLQELRDGSFCPMVTPDMLFTSLGRGYRGVNAYDCRSTGFCPDCDKRLG